MHYGIFEMSEQTAELPYFHLTEIYELMGYKTLRSAYGAVKRGSFPIKTYKLAHRIVADKAVVRAFFQQHRTEGLTQ